MAIAEPTFTFGMEEEYLLVDRDSRDLMAEPPPGMMEACVERLGGAVAPEFLRSQIEVATPVCSTPGEARDHIARLRGALGEITAGYGCAPIAASTHPFGDWLDQKPTQGARYIQIDEDLQLVARRLLTCGMHVHVGIEDPETRIDLMNQAVYFLPHLLALSTSSPFWGGAETGLMSYRLAVIDELPRTGLPERFQTLSDYERMLSIMTGAGLIEDATKLWWDVRLSARFPTIEMRITDVCTYAEDGLAIAAIFRCLCRMLWRLRRDNQRWRIYSRTLVNENRWRAQRYGFDRGLVDFGRGEVVAYAELLEEVLSLIEEDAAYFGCIDEIAHARTVLARGTGAHRQRAARQAALDAGKSGEEALRDVVDGLMEETLRAP